MVPAYVSTIILLQFPDFSPADRRGDKIATTAAAAARVRR